MSQFIFFLFCSPFWRKGGGKARRAGLTDSRQLVEFSLVVHRRDCFFSFWKDGALLEE